MLSCCVDRKSTAVGDEVGDIFVSSRRVNSLCRKDHFNMNFSLSGKIKDPNRSLRMILRTHTLSSVASYFTCEVSLLQNTGKLQASCKLNLILFVAPIPIYGDRSDTLFGCDKFYFPDDANPIKRITGPTIEESFSVL